MEREQTLGSRCNCNLRMTPDYSSQPWDAKKRDCVCPHRPSATHRVGAWYWEGCTHTPGEQLELTQCQGPQRPASSPLPRTAWRSLWNASFVPQGTKMTSIFELPWCFPRCLFCAQRVLGSQEPHPRTIAGELLGALATTRSKLC